MHTLKYPTLFQPAEGLAAQNETSTPSDAAEKNNDQHTLGQLRSSRASTGGGARCGRHYLCFFRPGSWEPSRVVVCASSRIRCFEGRVKIEVEGGGRDHYASINQFVFLLCQLKPRLRKMSCV